MRIRVVDAFTDRPFSGNPAGVCLLDQIAWPSETWMRQVASEMNLSETAFAHPLLSHEDADWALRWFTPLVETNLCGHATLATAHVLYSDASMKGPIRFSTRSGVLVANVQSDGSITLDFPSAIPQELPIPDGLASALGATPDATYATGTLGDVLVLFADEAIIRGLSPDYRALAELIRRNDLRGVIVTAAAKEPDAGYDYASRYFAPADGIPEDPVTGSAHTALAPYWSARLGRSALVGLQASTRMGFVRTELHGDRVYLNGRAVTVLDGSLLPRP